MTGGMRPQRSVQQRWGVLQAAVAKYTSCVAKVDALNPSGKTVDDKKSAALALYEDQMKKPFTMLRAWTALHNAPKFAAMQQEKAKDQATNSKEDRKRKCSVSAISPLGKARSEASSSAPGSPVSTRPDGKKKVMHDQKIAAQQLQATQELIVATNRKAAAEEDIPATLIMRHSKNEEEDMTDEAKEWIRLKQKG